MAKNFNWNIWTKKLVKNLVIIFVAGAASVYGNSELWLAVAPLAYALENWIKHR